jgi:hypothetical protein
MSFTNINEIDTQILQGIDDYSILDVMCQTSKRAQQLCKKDPLLSERLQIYKKYGPVRYQNYKSVLNGINPETGRKIRIGSSVYNMLLQRYKLDVDLI